QCAADADLARARSYNFVDQHDGAEDGEDEPADREADEQVGRVGPASDFAAGIEEACERPDVPELLPRRRLLDGGSQPRNRALRFGAPDEDRDPRAPTEADAVLAAAHRIGADLAQWTIRDAFARLHLHRLATKGGLLDRKGVS